MDYRHGLRAGVVASVLLALPGVATAVDCWSPLVLEEGLLGDSLEWDVASGDPKFTSTEPLVLPRNFALFSDDPSHADFPVPLAPLGTRGLWQPETPLPAGSAISFGHQRAITTVDIDTEPPTGVEVARIAENLCGDHWVALLGTPSDNLTPNEQVTYVLYLGASAEEAAATQEPAALIPGGNVWEGLRVDLVEPTWVAVSVLDLAGNESPRAEPVEWLGAEPAGQSATKGCSAAGEAGRLPSSALVLLIGMLGLWRRASRRSSH